LTLITESIYKQLVNILMQRTRGLFPSVFEFKRKMPAMWGKLFALRPTKVPFIHLSKEVLSIDLDSNSIRMVTVRKEGKRAIITSCATIDRPHRDIARDINSILKGKNNHSGQSIIVTDEVRFLASELNMPNVEKLPYDKVISMVSWEMEPYLDFPVSKGIFAYKFQIHKTKADTSPVLISAMNKETYSTFSKILKKCGLSLRHAYSPEVSFLSGFALPPEGRNKVIIDCRDTSIKGITLTSEGPSVFQDIPLITEDTTLEKAIRDLIYDLTTSNTGAKDIIIAGSKVSKELVEVLKIEFENLRLWEIQNLENTEVNPDVNCGPQYAAAVGAALQELRIYDKEPFGVTSKVSITRSLTKLVKENEYVLPAFALGLFFLCIAYHYTTVRLNMSKLSSEIRILKEEKSRLIKPIEEKKGLKQEIAEIRNKRRYLEGSLFATKQLLAFLESIPDVIPSDLVLKKISQNPDGSFTIEGNVYREGSAADFCNKLSRLEFCKEAKIERFNMDRASHKQIFPHGVIITVRLK